MISQDYAWEGFSCIAREPGLITQERDCVCSEGVWSLSHDQWACAVVRAESQVTRGGQEVCMER